MPRSSAALALSALAALSGVDAVTLEVYYGPYCPNSANYLSMYVQPLLSAGLPDLQMTLMPYAIDPNTHQMPQPCPSNIPGSPCGVLAAPLCALQGVVPTMPAPLTPPYVAAANFAICDLIHANHGAPMGMTHTQADIQLCATQNQADWGAISGCMANAVATPDYVGKIVAADAKLPPGQMAPFVFVNGQFVDNTVPLLPHLCEVMGKPPICATLGVTRLFEEQDLPEEAQSWPEAAASAGPPRLLLGAAGLALLASAALLAAAGRAGGLAGLVQREVPGGEAQRLVQDVDEKELEMEQQAA